MRERLARLVRDRRKAEDLLHTRTAELERAQERIRRLQDRLLNSEKMAAMGRLTAGIVHEINSPLGGVLNSLQLARCYVEEYRDSVGDPSVTPDDHRAIAADLLETLNLGESATRKVAQFVRSIRDQTRLDEDGDRRSFDPAEIIEQTVHLLSKEVRPRPASVHVEAQPGASLPGDPGKFGLVVKNLVRNALDACGAAEAEVWIRLVPGDGALRLEVEDRGCGIPEEIRAHVFDYLFTTKAVGRGAGLGLSIVHTIVTAYFGGEIEFSTEVGSGTTFVVSFPLRSRN